MSNELLEYLFEFFIFFIIAKKFFFCCFLLNIQGGCTFMTFTKKGGANFADSCGQFPWG